MMQDHPTLSAETKTEPLRLGWLKLLVLGTTTAVLAGVLSLYLQPAFLVTLATQVWACF